MVDTQQPREPTRVLIVSSTPPGGYRARQKDTSPNQQPSSPPPPTPDAPHPVDEDLGTASPLVQQPQDYNQPPFVQNRPPPKRSHSACHHRQPFHPRYNAANFPQSLSACTQMPPQGTYSSPNNIPRCQTGHSPAAIECQLSHQMQHYQRHPLSPTPTDQLFFFGYHTFVDPYGHQLTQVPTHHDPQSQAQAGSCTVSYLPSYPPHYPRPEGPMQTQFPPWCGPQMGPYHPVPPHYVAQQVPAQRLPPRPQSQDPTGQYTRCHSSPLRELPPHRWGSDTEPILSGQFIGYSGVSRCDGRMAYGGVAGGVVGSGGDGYGGQNYPLEPSRSGNSIDTSVGPTITTMPEAVGSTRSPSSSSLAHPALPRGPPCKPRQSGHALWVGNLPVGAELLDLKEHFSRDARDDIESVFLISKSNCAFVNYRTTEASNNAMVRFHESRFQGTKLVCRLRRGSAPSTASDASVPTTPPSSPSNSVRESGSEATGGAMDTERDGVEGAAPQVPTSDVGRDRVFIVKSLTVEDLDLSVRDGIWATQAHNEAMLNQAYETAGNVYLIFSANRSGQYYGYARMASPISHEPEEEERTSQSQPNEDPDLPRAIYTPATASAPQGRIIDDSVRGTIFWEAISDAEVPAGENHKGNNINGTIAVAKANSKPFRVQWISTSRVPFYKAKGLKNPWNANKEVKIARDGTELEDDLGRRLLQLFHRDGIDPMPTL